MICKTFQMTDQRRFAALTGDYNPMHMDPVAARRTQAGSPVVHGIHSLLWLLDQLDIQNVASLKASFFKMLYLGDRAEARVLQQTATSVRAQVSVDGIEVVAVQLGIGSLASSPPFPEGYALCEGGPHDLRLDQLEGRSGRVVFASDPAEIAAAFPQAARLIGVQRVAALGSSTNVVGMILPGLHSIYGGLDLKFHDETSPNELYFSVSSVNSHYRRVQLKVRSAGISGIVNAFSRPPPVMQPSFAELARSTAPGEFAGSHALIIGGSRGLGELTAKLIAAGGGKVTITYANGKADAERLATEIGCEILAYDALGNTAQLGLISPTHVYYFATPLIYKPKPLAERLNEFNEFYIYGFLRVIEFCAQKAQQITVLYPSTAFIDERPDGMTDYAMSKAAGELLCADIPARFKNIRVIVERLPRLPTDQTASIVPTDGPDSLSVMLPIVRKMHSKTACDGLTVSL
jgi:hypothetical protein